MVDTAEQVYISSLALLKMLKHGRAGVPMEVMGLMLGEFVDDYTVRVDDVFAMPQSGTSFESHYRLQILSACLSQPYTAYNTSMALAFRTRSQAQNVSIYNFDIALWLNNSVWREVT